MSSCSFSNPNSFCKEPQLLLEPASQPPLHNAIGFQQSSEGTRSCATISTQIHVKDTTKEETRIENLLYSIVLKLVKYSFQ